MRCLKVLHPQGAEVFLGCDNRVVAQNARGELQPERGFWARYPLSGRAKLGQQLGRQGRSPWDRTDWEEPSGGRRRGQARRRVALQRLLRDLGWPRCACGQTSTLERRTRKRSWTTPGDRGTHRGSMRGTSARGHAVRNRRLQQNGHGAKGQASLHESAPEGQDITADHRHLSVHEDAPPACGREGEELPCHSRGW